MSLRNTCRHVQDLAFRLMTAVALCGLAACTAQGFGDAPGAGAQPSGEMASGSAAADPPVPPHAGGPAQGGEAAPPSGGVDRAVISDEQDFEAVSSRETIESDRDRLQRQRDAFQLVGPEDLPSRPGGLGPNIVAYALSTTNDVGEPVYSRMGLFNESWHERVCARYGWSDRAQAAFLQAGGPERDLRGLDPDGDGFACNWDPGPFRIARQDG